MANVTDKVFDEALSLPANLRLDLVEKLLSSLDLPTQKKIDALWAKEAERRVNEIDRGESKLIPGEKVFTNIRRKYRGHGVILDTNALSARGGNGAKNI